MTEQETATSTSAPKTKADDGVQRVFLIPYPKFVFFYPSTIMCVVAAIWLGWIEAEPIGPENRVAVAITSVFLAIFTMNLVVIVFDFPRTTSLLVLFAAIIFGLGMWLVMLFNPGVLPFLEGIFSHIRPFANGTFYGCMAAIMIVMYIVIWLCARLDYWELRSNELIHHFGIWSDMKRFPAPNLRIDKEVNDVFEHMMLGAGRLVLRPATEDRAIVLDNVLFVNKKEEMITRQLGSLHVRIKTEQ